MLCYANPKSLMIGVGGKLLTGLVDAAALGDAPQLRNALDSGEIPAQTVSPVFMNDQVSLGCS